MIWLEVVAIVVVALVVLGLSVLSLRARLPKFDRAVRNLRRNQESVVVLQMASAHLQERLAATAEQAAAVQEHLAAVQERLQSCGSGDAPSPAEAGVGAPVAVASRNSTAETVKILD